MTLDFQSIIFELQKYWHEQGCLIWQPYHTEVGAGTMNPATFLRTLGPEPWNVAYVEPSIRPDDGRFGENPNRFYQHTQYQVILKPDRGNSQELYLGSLQAIGIDLGKHDVRFVEDNWAQPAISAWGLGWEVWLDGLEITQFTYFQQVGSLSLDPVSVELTYGLERIAMALQGVNDFKDIRWNAAMTFGDVYLQNEQEASRYAFNLADVDRLRQMFDLYEAEAQVCLDNFLVLPAHDYVLKCSHTFNILDTRGAVGVTERAGYFRRMRTLARGVAQAYVDQRQRLEYPWLDEVAEGTKDVERDGKVQEQVSTLTVVKEHQHLLIEIGTEELPSGDLEDALGQLRERVPALLSESRLEHGDVTVYATPRRLVISIQELAPSQIDLEEIVKGPPADRAFDADGKPTKAAEGFARSKGVAVSDLQILEFDGGGYVAAVVKERGRSTYEIIMDTLPTLLKEIHFGKAMRWNWTNIAFSRPIRWLLVLFGETVIPVEYAGLRASRGTRGLRFIEPVEFEVKDPGDYFSALEAQGIIIDSETRKITVQALIEKTAAQVGGEIQPDTDLLTEVTNLVETPSAVLGSFNPRHLDLPQEVLIKVMKVHQRYFPVHKNEKLLPNFVTIVNKPAGMDLEAIKQGNEDVIRARFEDAAYFVREDLETPLENYVEKLEKLVFQTDLGSMLDKTQRIGHLVGLLAPMVGLNQDDTFTAARAAKLCKADLATQMVVDMTSLQGVIGREYALKSGEKPEVATAIYEHYLPRHANDDSPKSKPGLVLGLADRIDALVGLFAAGLAPTGNKDPFAQRRAALGLVSSLIDWNHDFNLRPAVEAAAENLPIEASQESKTACLTFIAERLRNALLAKGYSHDIVDAVVSAQGHNPAKAAVAAAELTEWVGREDWGTILPAYSRCVRITRSVDGVQPDAVSQDLFEDKSEHMLFETLQTAESVDQIAGSVDDFLNAFLPMIPPIDLFFEDVLVMVEDESVRMNRLNLLGRIVALADGVADMSRLEGF